MSPQAASKIQGALSRRFFFGKILFGICKHSVKFFDWFQNFSTRICMSLPTGNGGQQLPHNDNKSGSSTALKTDSLLAKRFFCCKKRFSPRITSRNIEQFHLLNPQCFLWPSEASGTPRLRIIGERPSLTQYDLEQGGYRSWSDRRWLWPKANLVWVAPLADWEPPTDPVFVGSKMSPEDTHLIFI